MPRPVIAGMLRQQANVRPFRWHAIRIDAIARCPETPPSEAFGAVLSERPKHKGAAFMAYRGSQQGSVRGTSMRLIVGIIIGCALTVGGAYVADTMAAAGAKPVMVNWEVVAKNMDSVTTLARAGWKKIAGRAD